MSLALQRPACGGCACRLLQWWFGQLVVIQVLPSAKRGKHCCCACCGAGKGRHGILPEHLGQDAVIASATSRRDRLASLRLTAAAGDAKAIVAVGTSAAARVGEEAGRRTLGRGTTGTLTATHEEEEVELQGHAGALGASPASSSERLVSLGQKLHGGAGSLRQESGSSVHRSPSQGSMPIVSLQLQPGERMGRQTARSNSKRSTGWQVTRGSHQEASC